jgi:hypothetical protein
MKDLKITGERLEPTIWHGRRVDIRVSERVNDGFQRRSGSSPNLGIFIAIDRELSHEQCTCARLEKLVATATAARTRWVFVGKRKQTKVRLFEPVGDQNLEVLTSSNALKAFL